MLSLQFEKDMVHEMFTSFLQVMHIFLSEKNENFKTHQVKFQVYGWTDICHRYVCHKAKSQKMQIE